MIKQYRKLFIGICIIFIIAFTLLITNNIENHWDIIAADELMYLAFGKNLFHEIRFDWGFMYNVWYKLVAIFNNNSVDLYYLNYKILMVLVPVLLFILLITLNVQLEISFILTILFTISKLHITTWPFVSDFCIVVFLAFFIVQKYIKGNDLKSILFLLVTWLIYLTRPEYIIAVILASIWTIYLNRKNKIRWIFPLFSAVIIYFVQANTSKLAGYDRDFLAFAAHYAITYNLWYKPTDFTAGKYFAMAPKLFGTSYTLIGTFLYNPLLVLQHIITCIGMYFLSMFKAFEDLLLPGVWFKFLGKFRHVLFLIIMLITAYQYKKHIFRKPKNVDSFILISLALLFIPAMVPNFIIGFYPHYIQLHFILFLILIAIYFLSRIQLNIPKWILPILLVVSFIIKPTLNNYGFQQNEMEESNNMPTKKVIQYLINTFDGKKHILIASQSNLFYAIDGGHKFTGIDLISINKPFLQFIKEKNVDYVYIDTTMFKNEALMNDKEFLALLKDYELYGFKKVQIKNSKNYLLEKK